ncbi:apolipophorins-like [Pollicipes pollicipes]|uniref:apolipophorins-like n=1 Tax=Pollicipes pollicipes TaxID=41117 RepID=UPI00188598B6|nr:apolipophorins-like [Pollicipes pollicipes]
MTSLFAAHTRCPRWVSTVLRLESDFDGIHRPLELRVQTRTPTKRLEVRMDATYERGRQLSLYAGMPTGRLISVVASRNLYGMQVTDASLRLTLGTPQQLSAVLLWRWQIAVDVRRRAVARITALSADAQSWLADMTGFVREEAARNERFIQPVLSRQWVAVVNYSRREYGTVAADLRSLRDQWQAMYARDELFMNTIYQVAKIYLQHGRQSLTVTRATAGKILTAVRSAWKIVTTDFSKGLKLLVRACRLFSEAVQAYISEEIDAISAVAAEVGQAIQLLLDTVQSVVDVVWSSVASLASSAWSAAGAAGWRVLAAVQSAMTPVLDKLGAATSWIVENIASLANTASSGIDDISKHVKGALYELATTFTEQLLDVFHLNDVGSSTPEWINSLPGVELLSTIASTTKRVVLSAYSGIATFLRYNQEFLKEAWAEAVNLLSQIRDDVPPVRILFEWFQRIYRQTSWIWEYWEEGNQIRETINWAMSTISGSRNGANGTSGLNITDNSFLKFSPSTGYVEANLPLPVKWESFNKMPIFNPEESKQSTDLSLDVTFFYYELLDYINKVSPLLTADLWLPPYDAHALLAGYQHFLTFDNKFYEFAGDCSYLLAADLRDLSFALVVDYDLSRGRATGRSISAFQGNHTLRLVQGKSLFLDDRRVELPFRLGSTVVSRNGSRTILNLGHSQVACNVAFDVCVFHLSGQFHGRTGGLLGTYTNEAVDDFTSPSGQLLTRVDSFARTWEVRGERRSCRVKNLALRAPASGDQRAVAACKALFDHPRSALRPCYGIVNTAPFLRMCLNDLEANFNSPGRYLMVCTAAAAYVTECASNGVDIWMPPSCVRCELEDGHVLQAAETKLYRLNAPRLADVVIVVEMKSCQRGRSFRRTIRSIDDFLRRRGMSQSRFAIIGYGGNDIYRLPHIKTIKGEIWGTSHTTGRALDHLVRNLSGDSDDPSEVFSAIREACMLPFRGGVSKQIVVFSCSACPYREQEFPFTLKVLNLMDVKLSLVADTAFHLKKASRQYDSSVVAVGASLAYTTKDLQSSRRAGDSRLHPYVLIPKDLCSPLAIETNGTVFDGRRWSKPMRDLVAEVVAGAAEPSPCQECDCFADRDGVGKLECRTCISRTLQGLLSDFEPDLSDMENTVWFQDYETSMSVDDS